MRAFVVFTDRATLPFLGVLKKGFKHCFVVIQFDGHYVVVDKALKGIELVSMPHEFCDTVVGVYEDHGDVVVQTQINPMNGSSFGLLSCVAVVKNIIGVNDLSILTPYQLYRHLKRT